MSRFRAAPSKCDSFDWFKSPRLAEFSDLFISNELTLISILLHLVSDCEDSINSLQPRCWFNVSTALSGATVSPAYGNCAAKIVTSSGLELNRGESMRQQLLPGFTSLVCVIQSVNTSFVISPATQGVILRGHIQPAKATKLWQMMIEMSCYVWNRSVLMDRWWQTHWYVAWTLDGGTVGYPCDLSPLLHPSCGRLDLCSSPAARVILWWHLLSCPISTLWPFGGDGIGLERWPVLLRGPQESESWLNTLSV